MTSVSQYFSDSVATGNEVLSTGLSLGLLQVNMTQGSNLHLLCLLHWSVGFLTTSTTWGAQQLGDNA